MSDNDIKKALECCGSKKGNLCTLCPRFKKLGDNCNENDLFKDALDLINRLEAEIERLRHEYSNAVLTIEGKNSFIAYLQDYAKERKIEEIENRGIEKFARRIKGDLKKRRKITNSLAEKITIGWCLLHIDNLIKEMTEQSTGYGSSKKAK